MNRRLTLVVPAAIVLVFAGCGGGGSVPGADQGVPDVRGLALPDAKTKLDGAGFSSSVTSDGAFGVIVEENWTVCDQQEPNGQLVPVEVSKQC